MQEELGVIKNNHPSLRGGVAKKVTTIVGNASGCGGKPEIIDWAMQEGATVMNRNATVRSAEARYMDDVANRVPYPITIAAAGNDADAKVASRVRNGLVVGAANDLGDANPANLSNMTSFSAERAATRS